MADCIWSWTLCAESWVFSASWALSKRNRIGVLHGWLGPATVDALSRLSLSGNRSRSFVHFIYMGIRWRPVLICQYVDFDSEEDSLTKHDRERTPTYPSGIRFIHNSVRSVQDASGSDIFVHCLSNQAIDTTLSSG